tara:strand:- start:950 stop:1255 length:306 start_codon:yes stop_codon:yes gene_type:complete
MNKFLILPLILVGCTAPVTDPPAHACSPRLDGKPTHCGEDFVTLPREELRGDIDILNIDHWMSIENMIIRSARREKIEKEMTQPTDALDAALENYNKNLNN